MLPDIDYLRTLIRDTAREEILSRFNHGSEYEVKGDGSLITQADLAADQRIKQTLASKYPEIALLSEEMSLAEQTQLLESENQLWCVDPLDGTSNFAAGLPLFASSLALIVDGEVQIGISYDPSRDEMFSAQKGKGAWLNGKPLRCQASGFSMDKSVAIVDLKRLPPDLVKRLTHNAPFKSQRNLGASVLEWVWMAANRGQLYLHGGMKLWDLAAGSLILSEAGGHACSLDGTEVFKASMTPRSVLISPDKALFEQWKAFLLAS